MKRYLFLALVVSSFVTTGQIKNLKAEFGIYGNLYFMTDLRDIQSQLNSFPDGSKMVSSFPPFYAFDFSLKFENNGLWMGPWFAYQSSGGRNAYADYSGSFLTDFELKGYTVGFSVKQGTKYPRLFYNGNIGVTFNRLNIYQSLTISEVSETINNDYSSLNLTFIVGLEYRIINKSQFLALVGQLDGSNLGTNLQSKSGNNYELTNVTVDWTGLKFGIKMGL